MRNPLNLREISPLETAHVPPDALTVDVEDWHHVNYRSADLSRIDTSISRVHENTAEILRVLEETGSKATFFVLGCVAARHPELVREISSAGHEVGCHGYHHTLIYEQTPVEFEEDMRRAVGELSRLSGQKIIGFRAPSCSITERNPWALDALAKCGFQYDSSIFPIQNYMYGVNGFPLYPCRIVTSLGNALVEIPPQAIEFGPVRIPFGGGIYLRMLPTFLQRALVSIAHSRGRSFMLYFHPSDIDVLHLKIDLSFKERFFHNVGRGSGRRKIISLLRDLRWSSIRDAYSAFLTPAS